MIQPREISLRKITKKSLKLSFFMTGEIRILHVVDEK